MSRGERSNLRGAADTLSRRERCIMDSLYRRRRATAREIMTDLRGRSNATVRTQLRVLERKGHVRHVLKGRTFVYQPVTAYATARRSAIQRLVETFFDGSRVAAILFLENDL